MKAGGEEPPLESREGRYETGRPAAAASSEGPFADWLIMSTAPQESAPGAETSHELEREAVLARLRERIVGYAASRMQREAAEDLTQEVLLVLETKYPRVSRPDELVPLAFQILRFKMAAWRRKRARRGEDRQAAIEEVPLADPAPDPEAQAQMREDRERLRAALEKLSGRCRQIFRLKLEGKSFAEIQRELGAASLNTVYTWDYRCRQKLLELLGGRWETRR